MQTLSERCKWNKSVDTHQKKGVVGKNHIWKKKNESRKKTNQLKGIRFKLWLLTFLIEAKLIGDTCGREERQTEGD